MKTRILDYIDFEKVNTLLEGFNKSTGFVTAILDLEGNVLSKSGWRHICTEFHRLNPETAKRCIASDTVLANKMAEGEKYHFYKCLNGLIDVSVPIVINNEHVANLFTGQFFFEKPDVAVFKKQARKFRFDEEPYLEALEKVPVVSMEKVQVTMEFLLNMTQLISEITFQKLEQIELNEAILKNERILKLFVEHSPASIAMFDKNMHYLVASRRFSADYDLGQQNLTGRSHYEVFPEITGQWKDIHKRCLAGETIRAEKDLFLRASGKTDWVRWEIKPWHESENMIGGIILFSEVITAQINDKEELQENEEKYRSFFENSMDAILITEPSGAILTANPSACKLFGRNEQEIIEAGRIGIVDTADPRLTDLLAERERTGKAKGELYFKRKDGSVFPGEFTSAIFIDAKGNRKSSMIIRDIIERKLAEEALKRSEDKYRYMFVNNPQPMWIYDLETLHFLEVNNAAIDHYGYSKADFLKMTLKDIRPPEDVEALLKDVQLTRKALNPAGEWRHRKKNGELINVEIVSHSVSFNNIKARHVMITDITERKRTEEQLRESEKRFKLMFDHATFGIVICQLIRDKDGKAIDYLYLQVNESTLRHVGIKPLDILGKISSEVLSREDTILLIEKIKTVVETGIPFEYQQYFSTFNRTIDMQIIHIIGDYFSVVFFDVTEKKESEEKINKLNDRLQILVEAIKDLSIASDLETIMKTVRTSARRLVNADGSTFVLLDGDSCYYADEDTISPLWKGQRFPLNTCISGWAMLNKQSVKIEDIYSDPRIPIETYKSTFVKSMAMVPIRISDPLGAIGAYWKINYVPSETDLQLLQTLADATARAVENIRLLEGLEKMVETRTSQLEAANKELEAFSYSVSHDLRAPLRHINGFADILFRQYSEIVPEDGLKHLNTIRDSAKKMGVLIDDLLSFSRTGRAELKKSDVKMNSVIDEVLYQAGPSLTDRNIEWKIQNLPVVLVDYNLFRQVWTNLIENAIKYTQNVNQAVICIGFEEYEGEYIFSISDNGVGFDMKYSEKLFGVFQRLHTSSQFEGSGIGLANVQRIILRHGGRIWAKAEVSKGAAFYFTVPKESV